MVYSTPSDQPSKKPDKVCIAYDCAAVVGSKSLNEFLMKGPYLANSLVGVLLQFCEGKVAAIADVEAMFYQIKVASHNRDALRFFWWPQGKYDLQPEIYRMTVHIFGAKSSPSCATFCLCRTAR